MLFAFSKLFMLEIAHGNRCINGKRKTQIHVNACVVHFATANEKVLVFKSH